ncbi:MAG: hypothetical protein M5U14_17150 [Acidimicrobiia bacterium]|nr:hypothetical protein [Acidimicrobiia bacterium]
MNAPYRTLTAADVRVGDRLPELRVPVTATTVVIGASATRDWQPQHHDHDWAVNRAGTRDIFLNTPTQAGWIGRYVTDWTGPTGRIGRMAFRMRASICPGDEMVFNATVTDVSPGDQGVTWVALDIAVTVGETVCTACTATVAVPSSEGDNSWALRGEEWRIPEPTAPASGR